MSDRSDRGPEAGRPPAPFAPGTCIDGRDHLRSHRDELARRHGGTGLRHARGNPHNLRRLSRVEWPAGPIAASPFLSVGDSVVSGLALPYAMTVAGGRG